MKTIIEMAREAAAKHGHTFKEQPNEAVIEILTEMYAMGAAFEREACAKVCDAFGEMGLGVNSAAAAIRARGNT